MKVQIKDLQPNPYRDMKNYPIDRDKIQSLKDSINQTGFWDNILARKKNDDIQIAYGHHRLTAIRELFKPDDTVDIPVKELDDATMIRIMANENMDNWQQKPAIVIETIRVTRDFLNAELGKYESWKDLNKSIKILFKTEHSFIQTKTHGVGQTTILKFLGEPWKQHIIQIALTAIDNIEDNRIKEETITKLPSMKHVGEFTKAIRNENFTDEQQKSVVDEILEEETSSHQIPRKILETKWRPLPKEDQKEKKRKDTMLTLDSLIKDTHDNSNLLTNQLKQIQSIKDELGANLIYDRLEASMLTVSLKRLYETLTKLLNNSRDEK